ncbi:MAG: PEP-CTERM sorting domain-containing protein [Chthoniobacterales bacterium]
MRNFTSSFQGRLALITLAATALIGTTGNAKAQASLSFSGGNGTPFVFTLNGPVQYVINAAAGGNGPFFVFKNLGDVLGNTGRAVTGTITFSINNGPPQTLSNETTGVSAGTIVPTDLFLFGQFTTLTVGDTFTLTSGTLTTTTNVANAPPAGGTFTTYITDSNGTRISTFGVTVPEPSTWAMFFVGGAGLLASARWMRGGRRRSSL